MKLLLAILLLLIALPAQAQQSQGMSKALVVSSCGGGTLPNGSLNQLTMNTAGQLCLSGIGSGCPQATSYLGRTSGGNEGGNAANIIALICGLVTDGVWAKLDTFYVLAQQNAADANLNLVSTSYSLTVASGTPTFTSYKGLAFPSSAAMYTNFDPATAPSPNYTQNVASFGVWSYAVVLEAVQQMQTSPANNSVIYDNYTGGLFYGRVNDPSAGGVPSTISKGVFAADRPDASHVIPYQNGVAGSTQTSTAGAPDNNFFAIGGTAQTLSAAFIGASLGAAGQLALYNRLSTYMTAVTSPTGCAAATNYLARTSGGNEGGNAANITALICGLVTDGVITGDLSGATGGCGTFLDVLYFFAQQNQTDAKLNLCGTSYSAGIGGSPTFTAYQGFNGGAGIGYLDTGFNSTTATSPKYTQNSASYGLWSYADVVETSAVMGTGAGSNIFNDYTANVFYARVNNGAVSSVADTASHGSYVGDRTNSANVFPYQNGVSGGALAFTSAAPDNADFTICKVAGQGAGSGQTISEAHIGASLGATLELALYNRLRTYMTAVGVP